MMDDSCSIPPRASGAAAASSLNTPATLAPIIAANNGPDSAPTHDSIIAIIASYMRR
jgi:hypothetical protein